MSTKSRVTGDCQARFREKGGVKLRSTYSTIIMTQTAMTIRMDSELKVQFDALCDEFGMSTNTAFNIFARAVVRNRRIPFVIEASNNEEVVNKGKAAFDELRRIAAENGLSGMSLEEINKEIALAREGK